MNDKARKNIWPLVAYGALILLLTLFSLNGTTRLNKSKLVGLRGDYLLHVALFVPWMILAKWRGWGAAARNGFWFALGLGMLSAVAFEAVQVVMPNRTFDMIDLTANGVGVLIGAVVIGIVFWKREKAESPHA